MSLILGHLMRYVIVTPFVKEIDLSTAMRELRFEGVMRTFGIFYMDISLTNLTCAEIPEEDSALLVHMYKVPFLQVAGSSNKNTARLALIPSQLSFQHPWGSSIDILQLQDLIDTCPSQFLKSPTFLSEMDMQHPDSAGIFQYFSKDIWNLAGDFFHGTTSNLNTSNLSAAMEVWTIQNLQAHCHQISLQPSFDAIEVEGNLPKTSFLGRRVHFFPDEDEADTHPCGAYLQSETSYLSIYYRASKQSEDSHAKIDEDLDKIFSLLECLPASKKEKNKIVIWRVEQDLLQFIVNSSLYRVKCVTGRKIFTHRAQLTQTMLKKKLNPRLWVSFKSSYLTTKNDFKRTNKKDTKCWKSKTDSNAMALVKKKKDQNSQNIIQARVNTPIKTTILSYLTFSHTDQAIGTDSLMIHWNSTFQLLWA